MYVHILICTCGFAYECVCLFLCLSLYVRIYAYVCVWMCVFVLFRACVSTSLNMCAYCIYGCTCVTVSNMCMSTIYLRVCLWPFFTSYEYINSVAYLCLGLYLYVRQVFVCVHFCTFVSTYKRTRTCTNHNTYPEVMYAYL